MILLQSYKILREITQKYINQHLWFLFFACHLMLIDMKFHEDILNIFQVTEPKQFCDGQCSKGNNPKNIKARVVIFTL